jgi:hypothetical protein
MYYALLLTKKEQMRLFQNVNSSNGSKNLWNGCKSPLNDCTAALSN